MKQNKKGQMQMMETIGVIFIFFVLILFGSIFYFKFQEISFQERQEKLLAQKAMDITLISLFLPELQCSKGISEAEDNCVDLTKVRALQTALSGGGSNFINDYYFNIFGFANISVTMVYPEEYTWTIYEFEKTSIDEDGNRYPSWDRKEVTHFVVTLRDQLAGFQNNGGGANPDNYNPLQDYEIKYGFGYVTVEVYN